MVVGWLAACLEPAPDVPTGTVDSLTTPAAPPVGPDWSREVLATDLHLDLAANEGVATVTVAGSPTAGSTSLEVGALEVREVTDARGPLPYVVSDGPLATYAPGARLDVALPTGAEPVTFTVRYGLPARERLDGWNPARGVTLTWPYHCGNLFPCRSEPADGVRFTLEVTPPSDDVVVVAPTSWPTEVPSYVPALAVGDYVERELGATSGGTRVSAWALRGHEAATDEGTERLVAVVDWLERTLGPYAFGDHVGTVEADWGPQGLGGMEHHPFWHVASSDVHDEEVQAHEAAHGWFGDGVRIRCWEDFVVSEGTASWLAARALEEVGGTDVWPEYVDWLQYSCNHYGATAAWPATCGEVDLPNDPLWSGIPYMQGACFYEDVADLIGAEQVDGALSDVYLARVGRTGTMADVVAALKARSPADAAEIDTLVNDWLTSGECPSDARRRCLQHVPR
jgi:aminopeptidase N